MIRIRWEPWARGSDEARARLLITKLRLGAPLSRDDALWLWNSLEAGSLPNECWTKLCKMAWPRGYTHNAHCSARTQAGVHAGDES